MSQKTQRESRAVLAIAVHESTPQRMESSDRQAEIWSPEIHSNLHTDLGRD
jgi:hypothetical protein